jgi:hypothetical protein
MPTTIALPTRTSPAFHRATRRSSSGIPLAKAALIVWAMTLLLIGAMGDFSAQSTFPDAFQMPVAF